MSEAPRGIDPGPLERWLAAHVAGARAPFTYELITAGGSNLTYRVRDAAEHVWALRRPPTAARLPTAHDMSREWKILSGLAAHAAVPVPAPVAFCADSGVLGAPFYVMGFAEGLILRTVESARHMTPADCEAATNSLIDVQVAFHTLDPAAAGLADLGRSGSYVERQLHRWRTQYERGGTRRLPLLEELHQRLAKAIPPETARPALAHGDYRFDNTVLDPAYRVIAVLDWELCTLGDPVADFAWSLQYWGDPGDPMYFIDAVPTLYPGFVRRAEVARRYAERTGFDLGALDYYRVFSWWKMACIVEGSYARQLAGAGGGMTTGRPERSARRVENLLEVARTAALGVI
jgi:aminoglycoside phosphotransferase (APT) family kinase protein